MKNWQVGICIVLIAMSTPSWGDEPSSVTEATKAAGSSNVSLMGNWTGSYNAYVYSGPKDGLKSSKATMTLKITHQDGELVRGNHSWQLADSEGINSDIGGKIVASGKEDLVGVMSFDGKSVTLLETIDNGHFDITFVNDNELQAVYIESQKGEATTFRVTLKRAD